ncbi:MAG: cupin domain-containing protein [Dehalococcoidia bacterium]
MNDVEQIKKLLDLQPHPAEGGFFAETYRSEDTIAKAHLPERYGGERSMGTAIYYMVTPESFSAMHSLESDEVFHFYLGDPVEMLQLYPDGSGAVLTLGTDLSSGMRPQITVRRGVWQGLRLAPGGRYALLGATVAPGFDFRDFGIGERDALLAAYPAFPDMIKALTHVT